MLIVGTALRRCVIIPLPSQTCRLGPAASQAYGRPYSTQAVLPASNHEVQVKVKLGLSRHVDLAIRQPPRPEDTAPIILYLHGGLPQTSLPLLSLNELAFSANATIVRLDYRVSKEEPYPLPIHSVLAGYDWIRKHLLPARYTNANSQITERNPPQIGVCGELVGGSLATMLALTECHGEKRGAVKAAAVGNPIVDWTALVDPEEDLLGGTPMAQSLNTRKRKPLSTQAVRSNNSNSSPSRSALLSLRAQCFRKPEKYFDAFASPLLFFRTPRYAVPGPVTTMDPAEAEYALPPDEEPQPELLKRRLSHRSYPPAGSDLVLPRMRLEVGNESVLKEQGMEMVALWRRSQDKRSESRDSGAVNKIDTVIRDGSGLWGETEMMELGSWFGEVLRN